MSIAKTSSKFVSLIKNQYYQPQYAKFLSETDSEKLIGNLQMIERLFPDQVVMLCNRSHPKLQWVSNNCHDLFGITSSDFINLPVNSFMERIHPDDLGPLHQCFEFVNGAEPYDPLRHRFILNYRFRREDMSYIHLRDEKLAIESQPGRFMYFTLFKNLSQYENFFGVRLDITRYNKGNVLKVYTYNPKQADQEITPRQNEVIQLIVQGFSNQEIANRLHLSINTVKNHKRALFKKVKVRTTAQLVNAVNLLRSA
jgi:DNA-binding CsgD family transcriptional regulator